MQNAFLCFAFSSFSICCNACSSRSTITGIAPSSTPVRVMAAPIPFAPPVTRMTLSLSCKSIESGRVEPKELLLFSGREIAGVILNDFFYLRITGCQQTYGPVGAEHKTIRSESFKCHIQVRTKSLTVPFRPVGLRDQAGQFAVNISVFGHRADVLCPHLNLARLNRRLG